MKKEVAKLEAESKSGATAEMKKWEHQYDHIDKILEINEHRHWPHLAGRKEIHGLRRNAR